MLKTGSKVKLSHERCIREGLPLDTIAIVINNDCPCGCGLYSLRLNGMDITDWRFKEKDLIPVLIFKGHPLTTIFKDLEKAT